MIEGLICFGMAAITIGIIAAVLIKIINSPWDEYDNWGI